ncbi:MAG TPA: CHAT domain-containing protein, partial [Thermoanaerobaculia bacterium]|nr:CHAT domain-containing protein [Thermoanaerobaculia bacterium]
MEKNEYEELILWIRKDSAGYVAIPSGPAPVGTGPGDPFPNPFRDGELEEMWAFAGSRLRELDPPEKTARRRVSDLGERLFETVFAGKVRRFWDQSLDRARHEGRGLRLRLILESSELWDWPWEYLRDPDSDFLIFSPDISIVRCPEVPRPVPALRVDLPLRIVVVIAQPRGTTALDSAREWQELKRNLTSLEVSGRVELCRVAPASLATLRQELAKPIHVLHFIGHGGLDRNPQQGVLQFEKRDGEPDPVTGGDLARLLRRQSPPALVVLNACEGGRFAGVAQALVKEGVPAVVAMQFRVSDEAALVFSNSFYEALALGEPVDHAVYEARHALFSERSKSFGVDWGNPVLYLRGAQGKIFDFPKDERRPSRRRVAAAGGALLVGSLVTGGYLLFHHRPSSTTEPNPGVVEPGSEASP